MKCGEYYNSVFEAYCVVDVYPIRAVCTQCLEHYLETDPAEIRRINGQVQHEKYPIVMFCSVKCEREYEKSHFFYRLRKRKIRKETACDESPYW